MLPHAHFQYDCAKRPFFRDYARKNRSFLEFQNMMHLSQVLHSLCLATFLLKESI